MDQQEQAEVVQHDDEDVRELSIEEVEEVTGAAFSESARH